MHYAVAVKGHPSRDFVNTRINPTSLREIFGCLLRDAAKPEPRKEIDHGI
jgi:hypothetical protein